MRESNDDLAEFNTFAAEQHARLSARFVRHTATLQAVQANLLATFKRVRALRSQLLERYPELAARLSELETAREATLEQQRNPGAPSAVASASLEPSLHACAQLDGGVGGQIGAFMHASGSVLESSTDAESSGDIAGFHSTGRPPDAPDAVAARLALTSIPDREAAGPLEYPSSADPSAAES